MICKIWKAAVLLRCNHFIICTKTSWGSTCPTCEVRWTTFFTSGGKKVIVLYTLKHYFKLPLTWFQFFGRVMKMVSVMIVIKWSERERPFHWSRSVKIGSNCHCLLENCKIVDGQSSGVHTSKIKKERVFDKKTMINLFGKWGTLNRFNVPRFKILCKNEHSSISVFESVVTAGRLGSPMCKLSFNRKLILLLTPRALWIQLSWFYFLPCKLHFCIYICSIAVRVTKLWSKFMPFRSVCTLQSNRFKSVLCRKECGWFKALLGLTCPASIKL